MAAVSCAVSLLPLRFYQIRAGLKVSPRVPHRLIVTTHEQTGKRPPPVPPELYPSCEGGGASVWNWEIQPIRGASLS